MLNKGTAGNIDHPDTKKLKEALHALEMISILGDAEWKKQRAKQALNEISRIK